MGTDVPRIRTEGELEAQPEEFRDAIKKIVISHAINGLQGAREVLESLGLVLPAVPEEVP